MAAFLVGLKTPTESFFFTVSASSFMGNLSVSCLVNATRHLETYYSASTCTPLLPAPPSSTTTTRCQHPSSPVVHTSANTVNNCPNDRKSRKAADPALPAGGILRRQGSHDRRELGDWVGEQPAAAVGAAGRRPRRRRREFGGARGATQVQEEVGRGARWQRQREAAAPPGVLRGAGRRFRREEPVDILRPSGGGQQEAGLQRGPRDSGEGGRSEG